MWIYVVNLSIEGVIVLTASVITLICSLLFYRQYRKSPDLLIGALSLAWFFYSLTQFSIAFGVIFLNPEIYKLNPVFFCLTAFTAQITFDLIERAEIVFWHIGGISVIIGALIISSIFFNEVQYTVLSNGDQSLLVTGVTRNLVLLLAFLVVTQNFKYAFKIYKNAHTEFMNYKRKLLIGNFLFGPATFIAYFLQPVVRIPGSIDLLVAMGLILSTYSILRAPQLLFVLPFKAIQLMVIEAGTGTSLFSYRWTKSEDAVSDTLLTSIIEAINMFVSDSVNLGLINEINLKNGDIIMTQIKGTNKYIALIATKMSLSLKIGLGKFADMLLDRFKDQLMKKQIRDITTFQEAKDLINQCFPYTPNHYQ